MLTQRIKALADEVTSSPRPPSRQKATRIRSLIRSVTEALLLSTPSDVEARRATGVIGAARVLIGDISVSSGTRGGSGPRIIGSGPARIDDEKHAIAELQLENELRGTLTRGSRARVASIPGNLTLEAERLLKELPPKGRVFTVKDLAGFIQIGRALIPPKEQKAFAYVALGRSPAVLAAFLRRLFHMQIFDLPLGGLSEGQVPEPAVVEPLFEAFLPIARLKNFRVVVVIDYAFGGKSIFAVAGVLQAYLNKHLGDQAPHVMIAPITWKDRIRTHELSVLQGFDTGTKAAHRLLKVLFTELDKETFSPFASLKYDKLKANPRLDLARLAQPQQHAALERAVEFALRLQPTDGAISEYLLPRKKQRNRFSYSSFRPGYDRGKLHEEQWINNLRRKSAAAYDSKAALEPYIDEEAHRPRPPIVRRESRGSLSPRGQVVCTLLFVLFLLLVFWVCAGLVRAFSAPEPSRP